jgi:hypothetical protein
MELPLRYITKPSSPKKSSAISTARTNPANQALADAQREAFPAILAQDSQEGFTGRPGA